ncbi:hypothetical protein [Brevibacillus porteri]|uniref:hypothetical protein n=1 Tax=Brevibacillus porteri TaxID=2126350 RepID=UPI00364409C5
MVKKFYLSTIAVLVICVSIIAIPVHAAISGPMSDQAQADILRNVKNLNQLVDYADRKGYAKISNMQDFRYFFEYNKPLIMEYKPSAIDYGFTISQFAEVNRDIEDYGNVELRAAHGRKEMQFWGVPVIISNISDNPVNISKENFMLVPRKIPEGQELYTIGIDADAFSVPGSSVYLPELKLDPYKEVSLIVYFYTPVTSQAENMSLRIYDGKDHVDIHITK